MRSIDQAGHVEQHEGELKRPPLWLIESAWIARRAGDTTAGSHGNGEIYETERRAGLCVRDKISMPVAIRSLRGFHLGDEAFAGLTAAREDLEFLSFRIDPHSIEDWQFGQGRDEAPIVLFRQLREALHSECDPRL